MQRDIMEVWLKYIYISVGVFIIHVNDYIEKYFKMQSMK